MEVVLMVFWSASSWADGGSIARAIRTALREEWVDNKTERCCDVVYCLVSRGILPSFKSRLSSSRWVSHESVYCPGVTWSLESVATEIPDIGTSGINMVNQV